MSENVKLGACNVLFDGEDMGLTKGGVEVEVSTSTHEVTVDQHGETPVGDLITGRSITAKVPLVETVLDKLVKIMPGSTLVTDGAKATGTVTFSTAAPVNGDKVTVFGKVFTFKTAPKNEGDIKVQATIQEAADALADAINSVVLPVYASATGAVVTVTAENRGDEGNQAIVADFTTGANVAVVGMTGGQDVTKARVDVATGVNLNLVNFAKELRLRPIGTNGEEDLVIHKAACPGGLNFTYSTGQERIFNANFKGYVGGATTKLFSIGEDTAA